ncbi:helix-turn-helix domain-containing protein, partial [Staphylococcus aureus]|uniref:helix-turn-helix domain-containing protein n=1 Tax=Staphylococcus aureus TaxID=1280 RepID=UPI003D0A91BF
DRHLPKEIAMDRPPSSIAATPTFEDKVRPLAEVEADYIRHVLQHCAGNKTLAAELLGINRVTLRNKLRESGECQEG